jgi:hypothetical protein
MTSHASSVKPGDANLWAAALGLSLLCNAGVLLLAGFAVIQSRQFQHPNFTASTPAETVRIIAPELMAPSPTPAAAEAPNAAASAPAPDPAFTRTSDDQRGKRPDHPAFIGERNTQATSDSTPDLTAPQMPAQTGEQPRHPADIETTESNYQDGDLNRAAAANAPPPSPPTSQPAPQALATPPAPLDPATRGTTTETHGPNEKLAAPPPPARLAEGPHPVATPVPLTTSEETPAPGAQSLPREGEPDALTTPDDLAETQPTTIPLATPQPPAFSGYQRKTSMQGSISRTGRSALDVEDSPLGRYQAVISRAIELEWQRNCVRYRDRITPGFLTVRFFVDSKGNVRNVQSVGPMQTGQIQKGFTFNAIHDAAIPAMPRELRKDYQDDPLELIFNFYF